jgi:transposase
MEKFTTVGLDLAKNVFQVHGVNETNGVVMRKRLRRGQVHAFFSGYGATIWMGTARQSG